MPERVIDSIMSRIHGVRKLGSKTRSGPKYGAHLRVVNGFLLPWRGPLHQFVKAEAIVHYYREAGISDRLLICRRCVERSSVSSATWLQLSTVYLFKLRIIGKGANLLLYN